MSIATLIIGESGTGKSTALRNLEPSETLLIQSVKKPLPFKKGGWKHFDREANPQGNIFVTDRSDRVIHLMTNTKRKVIVIDDFQYMLANEFMRRSDERGFDKFTEIGRHAWDVLMLANTLPDDVRVYILGHTQTDDMGKVKVKTIGKMLDEKITVEGLFSIVLKTVVQDKSFLFSTQNNGSDTVKSPMGLFESDLIENDLELVDKTICSFYEIKQGA